MKTELREALLERINTMLQNVPQHADAQELLWQQCNSLLTDTMGRDTPENRQAIVNLRIPALNQGTLLHFAAENGHTWLARELLKWGADPNSRNSAGQTPLHRASAKGQVLAFGLLLDNGASNDVRDNNKQRPFTVATAEMPVTDATIKHAANALDDMQKLLRQPRSNPVRPTKPAHLAAKEEKPRFVLSAEKGDVGFLESIGIDGTRTVRSSKKRPPGNGNISR